MHEPFTILFEDNHCLAAAKPAPLPTQASAGVASLEAFVRRYLTVRYHRAGHVYLGVPHRLDRPVTGVVLFARNSKAARRIAEQFQMRQVRKIYWALVEGAVEPEAATLEDFLRKVAGAARTERMAPGDAGAQRAVLHYRRLCILPAGTLLEIELETGRMHQIRAQLAARGCPVRGDVLYGAGTPWGDGGGAIALHARRLTFLHPIRYEPVTVTAPLPAIWEGAGL